MDYTQSLDYIKSLIPTLEKPSLERIELFYRERAGSDALDCFHVGGTNGKGSVTTLLVSMLAALGHKCGKFTGPHLVRFNERFVIDGPAGGGAIGDSEFAAVATAAKLQSDEFKLAHPDRGALTWFEFLFAMAVEYFKREKADYAVFEVGMGGRFDATNVLHSVLHNVLVSVITNVDLDHMQFLGNTRAAIAFEKSGIIKAGVPVVTTCDGDAFAVILQRAAELGSVVYALRNIDMARGAQIFQSFTVERHGSDKLSTDEIVDVDEFVAWLKERFFSSSAGGSFIAGLPGAYQRVNVLTALLALWASRRVVFNDDTMPLLKDGLLNARWSGRFEIIESGLPARMILDGAHNPHGAAALRSSLEDRFGDARFVFIVSCFENKNAADLLGALVRSGDTVIAFKPTEASDESTRKMHDGETLAAIARSLGASGLTAETFADAVEIGRELLTENMCAPYLVVAGSFVSVRAAINLTR